MGAFFTNLQIRAGDAAPVVAALEPLLRELAWVSPSGNGWVSVYPEATERQDARVMERLASALSASLATAVLGVLLHDSDVLHLWTYEGGALLDEYDSEPGYFGRVSKKERQRLAGRPEVLAVLAAGATTAQAVQGALSGGDPVFVESRLEALADLLSIPAPRALAGYNDIDGGNVEIDGLVLAPAALAAERRAKDEALQRQRAAELGASAGRGDLAWTYEVPALRKGSHAILHHLGFDDAGRFWIFAALEPNAAPAMIAIGEKGREVSRDVAFWHALSPDGEWVARSAGVGQPVELRRSADLSLAGELPVTAPATGAIHLAPGGTHAAINDYRGTLTLYELSSGAARTVELRGRSVRCWGWSPDGRKFARTDGDDAVSTDVATARDTRIPTLALGIRARCACYLPDSERLLVGGDGGAAVFRLDGTLERILPWPLTDEERKAAMERIVRSYNVRGTKTTAADLAVNMAFLARSAGGVAATSHWLAAIGADGILRFWSPATGEPLGRRDTQQALQWGLFASAAGDRVVTAGNPVLCWNVLL